MAFGRKTSDDIVEKFKDALEKIKKMEYTKRL
jgi:hypothetical protein